MPGGPKAKKVKHNRSISRLKHQSRNSPSQSDSTPRPTPPQSGAPSPECSDVEDDLKDRDDFKFFNHFDSLKADFEQEDVEDWSDDDDDEKAGGDMVLSTF
jgi:hypothetical protein